MKSITLRNLVFAAVLAGASARLFGSVVNITVAPPPLKVYVQAPCPAEGYIWTPGYWAYTTAGYTWVPGAWVLPPQPGYLFTPGYWDLADGVYIWHRGFWGLHVGYYGGVNYGFGYFGAGFTGGRWEGGRFFYNREVANVGERFRNTYRERVSDHGRAGAGFHDRREDRHDDRRADRREDRKEDRREARKDNHSRSGGKRGGAAHEHPTKAAAHSRGASGHSQKSPHRA